MLKEKLDALNIFALRDFARKMGVKSPTNKTKAELIKRITAIANGEEKRRQSRFQHA